MEKKNIFSTNLIAISLSTLFLVSCGGGSTSNNISTNTTGNVNSNNPSSVADEPVQIDSNNWTAARLVNRNVAITTTSYSPGTHTWSVDIIDDSVSQDDHLQVFLDTDNNPATGYQFENKAWANKSGADYLIEDNVLFKSTASNSSWSWKYLVPVEITKTPNSTRINVPVSRFKGLCNTYSIGTIGMTSNWDIETFYPVANDMVTKDIAYCDSTISNTRPIITLDDTTTLIVELNSNFVIPTARATDVEDGDISADIHSSSNVNTAQAGAYEIVYTVSDSKQLAATPVKRSVIVKDSTSTFVIDGNTNDWSTVSALAEFNGNTLKVFDDQKNLYILVESTKLGSNTQILINSDNSTTTGTAIHGNGIDYMVENIFLSKYIGSSNHEWAWEYGIVNIPLVKRQNVLEMSIPKTALVGLADTINIGFKSLTDDWIINYSVPNTNTKTYHLIKTTSDNTAPIATNDRASTDNISNVLVDVLNNDSDPDSDELIITEVSTPTNGVAVIVGNKVKYTPNLRFVGNDSFTYSVSDDHLTATATVTVNVTDNNRPPIASEDAPSTEFNTPIEIDVLANDSDPDGDPLTIVSFSQPPLGVVTQLNPTTLLFDPQGNVASISFTYKISDSRGGTDTAGVTIASFDPTDDAHSEFPEITGENITINAGESILIDVLANDFDPDGDTLNLDEIDDPAHGTTKKIDGKVEYTPDSGFVGTDEFYYGVHDGFGHNGAGKVTIIVQ